jgi:hypothetical protein
VHIAQAKNYVVAYDFEIGLLINFGAKSLEYKRIFNDKNHPANGAREKRQQEKGIQQIPKSSKS